MAANTLGLLLCDYNSDSELDENVPQPPSTANKNISAKLNKFLSEIESESVTNWTQCIDANTGHPYYWNIVTKEVTWEIPAEYEDFLKKNATNIANSSNTWALCYSDEQTPYYFNEITREISWVKPDGFIEIPNIQTQTNSCDNKSPSDKKTPIKEKSKKTVKHLKKKYPFDEPEVEKIELISSYSPASGSSSDEESGHNKTSRKRETAPSTSTKLNLVPEYNSDDDSEETEPSPKQKTLFAATCDNAQPNVVQAIKLNLMKTDSVSEPASTSSDTIPKPLKKPKSSFASIITGGRSPQQQSQDLLLSTDLLQADDAAITAELSEIETEHLSQKLFKRKRRIEFITTQKRVISNKSSPLENEMLGGESSSATTFLENNATDEKADNSLAKSIGNSYGNFQKGGTEFTSLSDTGENSRDGVRTSMESPENTLKKEIIELKGILNAKLKFLCQGRTEVSPVQIIDIQLQALTEAYAAGAVRSEYILKWLENVSTDLIKLESEVAPDGWECLWDREKSQYCYKNVATNEVTWEYPEQTDSTVLVPEESIVADDEMDISTTPPPNLEQDAHAVSTTAAKVEPADAPAPPTWQAAKAALMKTHMLSGEPLPPGIDISEYSEKPMDNINNELASFYSDIASLEQTTSNASHEDAINDVPSNKIDVQPVTEGEEEKKKKKKKKVKKLEPWRSGNLETWINKWQKAQKELDG